MKIALVSTIAIAAIGFGAVPIQPRLIWNVTASAPRGLYLLSSELTLRRGDLMLVRPPTWVRDFAARRGYLAAGVPLVKRIAALAGDRLCGTADAVWINGRAIARRHRRDGHQRPLPAWVGCKTLGPGDELLLMADVSDSFDGRYFGPTPIANNLGHLTPLWTY